MTETSSRRLNDRQIRFADEYLVDLNATQAALRAGYSDRSAASIGWDLLQKPEIQALIQAKMAERAARTGVTQDRVVAEFARIAFGDIRQLFDADGRLRPVTDLPDAAAAAIASIEVVSRASGGPAAPVEFVHKIRLWNKGEALTNLGRHLGMFREKDDASSGVTVIINGDDAKL